MTERRPFPWQVFLRSFAIQGSWNYETLTGTGFGFSILPALRRVYPEPEKLDEAIRRHEQPFNSHPYLAPLALGAVIRLEEEGEDPALIERFKAALRGALGTLGDQLVWAGWRPVCVLLALALILGGVHWAIVVGAFLIVYNSAHVAIMAWGLKVGLSDGRAVGERLRGSLIQRTYPKLLDAGGFLTGVAAVLLFARGLPGLDVSPGAGWLGLALVVVLLAARFGQRARRAGVAAVGALAVMGLLLGVAS
jgi:mannose PTS system EIID component